MPIYHGFRGQEQAGIRVTKGSFASEGVGVYIALDKGLSREFVGTGGYLQELEFDLDNPLVIRNEPLYMLTEAAEVEEPVQGSDSDWLKANKLAYQMAMEQAGDDWSEASELVGQFITHALRKMGYDGVIVDHGKNNRWAVVFEPDNVMVLNAKVQAHASREMRLAKALAYSRKVARVNYA